MKNTFFLIGLTLGITAQAQKYKPLSETNSKVRWKYLEHVSDEFNKDKIDEKKWLIQGRNGEFQSRWIGRAPSQFSTENVFIKDGKCIVRTQWDPDFEFSKKLDKASGKKYENITTGALISRKEFQFGYMEIKCKAADAPITSSFWATGKGQELDVFEFFGQHIQPHKIEKRMDNEFLWTIIDWTKKSNRRNWRDHYMLDWRVADDFHVYGCEWSPEYLKFYADGKLLGEINKRKVLASDSAWILVNPMKVWVDSETFPWNGIPTSQHLPADFEIDYIRIWDRDYGIKENITRTTPKKNTSIVQNPPLTNPYSQAFGFEGAFELPKGPDRWFIPNNSKQFISFTKEKSHSGASSLKFETQNGLAHNTVIFAPFGSVQIPSGTYELTMKVWIDESNTLSEIQPVLEEPYLQIKPIKLSKTQKGKWITVKQTFSRMKNSGTKDRVRLIFKPSNTTKRGLVYIDDIRIQTRNSVNYATPPKVTTQANEKAFSFEGPFELDRGTDRWYIPNNARDYYSFTKEKSIKGSTSLKFSCENGLDNPAVIFAPFGSTNIQAGMHELSMKVWIAPSNTLNQFQITLEDPYLQTAPINLSKAKKGEWITIKHTFNRNKASNIKDRIRLVIQTNDVSDKALIYFDDIKIKAI
ncbi:family 16 glycosylhydrolase [Reichenbachiella versicolor]|uniref:family 16 glycosylhydrolase n=1 Tax=Reichenbachiella versicolor TaxID=1821036 RepID=UPI0013A55C82|nr:family 16 glycosylhydrolase [Reichenbachiella versicolor]